MGFPKSFQIEAITQEGFPQTWATIQSALNDGVTPGVCAGFWKKSEPDRFFRLHSGVKRKLPSEQKIEAGTLFDISSVSKLFTATLVGVLVERGWLKWDQSVSSVLEGFQFPEVKIYHLLSHTAGYAAWQPFFEKMRSQFGSETLFELPVALRQSKMRELVMSVPPEVPVGTRTLYSDFSFLLLGFIIEDVLQRPLDEAMSSSLFRPMKLKTAHYNRTTHAASNMVDREIAATEDCPWRKAVLQGQVHDDNCWAMGGYAGHTGIFCDVMDLLIFSKRLFEGFLSQSTLGLMWSKMSEPEGCDRTLGWDTVSRTGSLLGSQFGEKTVGHWGFTGTSLWIDPAEELAVVLLTNRVHPSRENEKIKLFRPAFHDALRLDLRKNSG